MIGATGPQMMELAGEIADGVVLNYCVPPEYNLEAMEQLERGAARAGRKLEDIDRPQLIVCSVHEDRKTALDGARELLTQYLAQQPHIAKASGVKPEVVSQIQAILGWPATHEQVRRAMPLVPDELVQRITASGTPTEVKAKVREYMQNGATCPILYPLGDVKMMIDAFASGF
jgi:5,10-methylenetetrahydromethanopterin reductase